MNISKKILTALLILLQISALSFLFADDAEYTFEASSIKAFSAGSKTDGQSEVVGSNGYFTVYYSAKSKVDGSSKNWANGYSSSQRLNLQGAISIDGENVKNAIKITTSKSNAPVKIWWVEGGDDKRQIVILDSDGNQVCTTNEAVAKNGIAYSELTVEKPGTYYIGSSPNNNYIFRITVVDNSGFSANVQQEVKVNEKKPEKKNDDKVIPDIPAQYYAGREWNYAAFGTSTNTTTNGISGNIADGKITVFSEGGKGKIVPNSTDGLSFFYTKINPQTENFTLSAKISVDSWTYSNGQEGFGIMIADTIGKHGSTDTIWNNSIMAMASKVEYKNEDNAKISMKLGIGTLVRLGVTSDDEKHFIENGNFLYSDGSVSGTPEKFTTVTTTLEESCASLGSGTYNIVGNYTAEPVGTRKQQCVTSLYLTVRRDNTGYTVTYRDESGETVGEYTVYDTDRCELTRLDPDNIYLGFFAARNARITVSDISFTTIAPEMDSSARERQIQYVNPDYKIESGTTANSDAYTVVYYGNADGTLSIKNGNESIAKNVRVKAEEKYRVTAKLQKGYNEITAEFTPDKDYMPDPYTKLSHYGAAMLSTTVEYRTFEGSVIYVSPTGRASGKGTKQSPLDIYTAVKFVAPGQTISLLEGTYKLINTVRVERGINGSTDKPIKLVADPSCTTRPVFDFSGRCAGFVFGGNYWYLNGFDVTNSQDGQKGIQISGSNNTVENIRSYRNGNTGIQISRLFSSDLWEDWPSNNRITGCLSFLNADNGYEDADGFAAKLTIADGNTFDNCISAYNADDGWDLYAKVETGPIGVVEINNCISFKNGFVFDSNGNQITAGNGNGFKLGGESISGKHVITGSIAFANRGKGIDSNSCPDIIVKQCTSFNNGSYNVAFYTSNAANTDFRASGLLSFRTDNGTADQLKLKGTQKESDVYKAENYYVSADKKSTNVNGGKAQTYWFENTDMEGVINSFVGSVLNGNPNAGQIKIKENGKIDLGTFLKPTAYVPEGTGASF